jgi:putative ABC transport system permease protein
VLRIALAGLRAHPRRVLGTLFAVVFGVAFVSGTFIFTDTAKARFYDAFARTGRNVDLDVAPPFVSKGDPARLSADQLATVRKLPDVAVAEGRIIAPLAMLDKRGKPISNFGRVGVAVNTDGDARLHSFEVQGRVPANSGEAMLDVETAAHQHMVVGDQLTVADQQGQRHSYTVVGLLDFGASKQFSGDSVVGLPAAEIVALTGVTGYDEIVAIAKSGVPQQRLADAARAALGTGPNVVTGDQYRRDLANAAVQVADQFVTVLLIFAVISLVVAAFVIYNTFAILVAPRVRETALLRCVGASRTQVFGSVLAESAVVGLVGGVLGVLFGIAVAYGLTALLNTALHAGVPNHSIVLGSRSVLAGLAIALVVTVASALIPAVRATRTSPLAALRDMATVRGTRRRGRIIRLVLAGLVGAVGIALTVSGVHDKDPQTGTFVVVAGGVVTFLAVLIASPAFIGPLVGAIGAAPTRLFRTPARLAVANTRRNPGRAAITTATLMIGVGLMSLFSIFIASIRATASAQIVGHYPVDYVLEGVRFNDGGQAPVPAALAAGLRQSGAFSGVAEVRVATVGTADGPMRVAAVDPGALGTVVNPEMSSGRLSDLRNGTAIALTARSRMTGVTKGGALAVTVGKQTLNLTFVGTSPATVPGEEQVDAMVSWADMTTLFGPGDDTTIMAKAAPGLSPVDSRDRLDQLAEPYPLVEVNSIADLSSELDQAVNQIVSLFAGLLATTVIIAIFGIANTLSLSVVERTRESATARALGLTRGQLRATLLAEAALLGLVGAVVGVGYGAIYGRLVVGTAFKAIGPTLVVPWSWLIGLVVLAAVAGLLAAVLPARRAAQRSIVSAMAET